MAGEIKFNRLKECRYGTMLYNVNDIYVGRSFELYGEFSEGEVALFRQVVRPGSVVLDVGANIGAHTLFFAGAVGPEGSVFAFEPQRIVFQTLCANMALNSVLNVHCYAAAVGERPGAIVVPQLVPWQENNFGGLSLEGQGGGEAVEVKTIDGMGLPNCHLIKIDVEGMEIDVLRGATETIAAHRPVLFVENDREEKSEALVRHIDALGYDMYWHRSLLYNPDNFLKNSENVFGNIVSINMLCIPRDRGYKMEGFHRVEIA